MADEHDLISMGVAAALAREYANDGREFVPIFARMLEEALPEETEPIRTGSFLSKKTVSGLTITLGDFRYALDASGKGAPMASRTHIVRGIALKSEPMPMEAWIREVGSAIEEKMKGNARAHAALIGLLRLD